MLAEKKEKFSPKEDIIKNKIQELNPELMIKETVNSCLERHDISKLKDNKEELLKILSEQSMNNYMEYVKGRSNKEGKDFLKKELDLYNNKLKAILAKSNNDKNDFKNKYLNALEENKNLKEKILYVESFNKNLLQQIHQLEINSANFEIQMNNISKKQLFLNDLFERYPGKNENEILKYLDDLKAGSIQLLEDYQNMQEKIKVINKEQQIKEKEYKTNINKVYLNNEILMKEKNDMENQYFYKMNKFDYIQKTNEEQKDHNIYLTQTLFHIYNLLFKEFGLNRNLSIDKKFLDIKESDFNPDFLYNEEIKNYIELMIKSMHHDTYDILFRETLGYLNMILRIYLPNKFNLRFQPIKAFKEIKDFIDSKMTIIEDNNNLIKSLESTIEQKNAEINKLTNSQKELNKEYNLYKNLVEKEFIKSNKIIYQLKNSNSKKDVHKTDYNINKMYNKTFSNIRTGSFNFNIRDFTGITNKKLKIKRRAKILNTEEIESFRNASGERNKKNIIKSNKKNKTYGNSQQKKIKKGKNSDKIVRENGNQQRYNDIGKLKLLIDETNRLFLYKSRMNSTTGRHLEDNNKNKNRILKTYTNNFYAEEDIKNKIFKQINHLIKTSYN